MNPQNPHQQPAGQAAPLSPLGALFGREAARLAAQYPQMEWGQRRDVILLRFALLFRDVTAAELELAVREGSPDGAEMIGAETQADLTGAAERAIDTARHLQNDDAPSSNDR